MKRAFGLILLIGGAVLLYYAWQANETVGAGFSSSAGAPTLRSFWLLGGGLVASTLGLFSLFRGTSH